MGARKLTEYAKNFGFGEPTGIELPGEEAGILFDPDYMVDSDIATMAIGQSIAVTPIQLVAAMSAVANDGVLLKPHIVKMIKNANGTTFSETKVEEVRRSIESATDKTLVNLLEQVVSTGGGGKAKVKGYRIAGKTGTAQKIREDELGYQEGRYIASFCGFAPVENPRLTMLVMIDDPYGTFYGGQIAAPVAGRIFSQIFRYLRIEPSDTPAANEDEDTPEDLGEGDAAGSSAAQSPSYRHTVAPAPEDVPSGNSVVPDFYGKSIREAARLANNAGLKFESDGSGFAVEQSIGANSVVASGTTVKVYFAP